MPQTVLQTQGLTKRFGSLVAAKSLSLEVYEGEVFGLLGPNGAGKTTSIRMLCGLLKPDAGEVLIRGKRVDSSNDDVRSRVGICPQEIVIWPQLTCIEQLVFMGQMYDVPSAAGRRRAESLLTDLGLLDKKDARASTLSGGMQRRLNIALALMHDPEIVVLDEPEAGLDPQSRVRIREFVKSIARKKTVILTTHNMDEADRMADRIAIIDHGELLVVDTPEALKRTVGEGDVVTIELSPAPLSADVGERAKNAVASFAQAPMVDLDTGVLSLRALDAVGSIHAILAALQQTGLKTSGIKISENTLEDVFLQLTGRKLRE
jgi:ABC-2 type transport system ATP-binding protein